ncbi:MAG: type II toxin-antitoxin system VapC family toxin [Chloroflexota bacterium]|nr:type II toxin-antitoxin system VapC family toxin [Chloroflexota bacterium]
MSKCVVDTDVVSFLFKQAPEAQLYLPHLTGNLRVVSFMTVAELDRWALTRNWGAARNSQMETHLRQFVIDPFDRTLCRVWAQVVDSVQRQGRTIHTADAWIAATALLHDIPLMTHNRKDYEFVPDLKLISES